MPVAVARVSMIVVTVGVVPMPPLVSVRVAPDAAMLVSHSADGGVNAPLAVTPVGSVMVPLAIMPSLMRSVPVIAVT